MHGGAPRILRTQDIPIENEYIPPSIAGIPRTIPRKLTRSRAISPRYVFVKVIIQQGPDMVLNQCGHETLQKTLYSF
jgi:hypothetical protein